MADRDCLTEPDAMDWLEHAARTVPGDQAIIEVGVYRGCSLAALGRGAKMGHGAQVIGIDPYGLPGPGDRYNKLIPGYGPANLKIAADRTQGLAVIRRDFGANVAATWSGPRVGLLFIDAVHQYEPVLADFRAWEPHLADDAIIAFDDYWPGKFPGVVQAVDELFPHHVEIVGKRLAVARISRSQSPL